MFQTKIFGLCLVLCTHQTHGARKHWVPAEGHAGIRFWIPDHDTKNWRVHTIQTVRRVDRPVTVDQLLDAVHFFCTPYPKHGSICQRLEADFRYNGWSLDKDRDRWCAHREVQVAYPDSRKTCLGLSTSPSKFCPVEKTMIMGKNEDGHLVVDLYFVIKPGKKRKDSKQEKPTSQHPPSPDQDLISVPPWWGTIKSWIRQHQRVLCGGAVTTVCGGAAFTLLKNRSEQTGQIVDQKPRTPFEKLVHQVKLDPMTAASVALGPTVCILAANALMEDLTSESSSESSEKPQGRKRNRLCEAYYAKLAIAGFIMIVSVTILLLYSRAGDPEDPEFDDDE